MSISSALITPIELAHALESIAMPMSRPGGCLLFERGSHAEGVFLIRKGNVTLQLDGATDAFPLRVLGPGAVLGLPATLSGGAYSLTAITRTDCELGYIPREIALNFLRANSALCFQAMLVLSEEISGMRSVIARVIQKAHEAN